MRLSIRRIGPVLFNIKFFNIEEVMGLFRLKDSFLDSFRGKQPDWGPIGRVVFLNKYAREKEEGGQEEFWETLKRVVEGVYETQRRHCESLKVPWNAIKAQNSAQEMYRLAWEFKWTPPGRGLQNMGASIIDEKGGAPLNNCAFCSTKELTTDFAAPFTFLMDMSMLGVGVGGDTRGAGTVTIKKPKVVDYTYVVADTREGWVDLIETVLNSYVGKGIYPNNVDYSKIRPKGTKIKGLGGTSSGYEPLETLVKDIEKILSPLEGEKITSTAIVDIFNAIGKAVISGNVRRTAEVILGAPDDEEFIALKDPELFAAELIDRRWTSNNSVLAEIGTDYNRFGEKVSKNGEPGFIWLNNMRNYGRILDGYKEAIDPLVEGANPCLEQSLEPFELCCLVETYPSRCVDLEEYKRVLKYAYLYAKTVTLIPTHNPRTNAVMLRNRRIGTSQTGIAEAINMRGIREHMRWCDEGYKYIKELDKIYSRWLCIPESVKVTSVKPSGTVSLLPGVTPGVHYPESEYYIRHMRIDSSASFINILKDAGYRVIQQDTYSKTSAVVGFPVKERNFKRAVTEVSMWEQLELAAQMQHYWADNQVSCTVKFHPEEAKDIPRALAMYETRLKGISFLPYSHGYDYAPYVPITKKEYDDFTSKIKEIKFNKKESYLDGAQEFCSGEKCELVGLG